MLLAETQPYASWTSRVFTRRKQFVREYPDFADTARVLLAIRPDFKRLRYIAATVSQQHTGQGIARIADKLKSAERFVLVWVWVWPTNAGLIADTVIDREWEPWERRSKQ